MTALLPFPATETMFARLTQRQAEANEAAERAECIWLAHRLFKLPRLYKEDDLLAAWEVLAAWDDLGKVLGLAERIIDKPAHIPDAVLRKVCDFHMKRGSGGVHYLRAQQHIDAINRRERIARNKAAQSSWAVVQEQRDYWPQIFVWGAVVATALLAATGWLG